MNYGLFVPDLPVIGLVLPLVLQLFSLEWSGLVWKYPDR